MMTSTRDEINDYLKIYFAKYGKPKRLNEQELPYDACSINLKLRQDHKNDDSQHRLNKIGFKNIKILCHPGYDSFRVKDEDICTLVECFGIDELLQLLLQKDKSESRVFISGSPNIGKTVLCKKLVHEFYNNNGNNEISKFEGYNTIEHIIWIPLRTLVHFYVNEKNVYQGVGNEIGFFEKYMSFEYFSCIDVQDANRLSQYLVSKFVDKNNNNCMYILDGLDEIIDYLEDDVLGNSNFIGQLVQDLLAKPCVICTSRPYAFNLLHFNPSFSLNFELVGLSLDNVFSYLNNNQIIPEGDENMKQEIIEFIQDNKIISGLITIPGYLDLLIICWNEIEARNEENVELNTTMLHEAMIIHLLREYAKHRRPKEVLDLTVKQIMKLTPERLETRFELLLTELEVMAFSGLVTGNSIIGLRIDPKLPEDLKETLHESPFLIQIDITQDLYEFNTYLIQEYFTARRIANKFLLHHSNELEELKVFVLNNKYNVKYQMVWRFVVGILSSKKLSTQLTLLFNLFQQPPRDLFHVYHYDVLLAECLNECNVSKPKQMNRLDNVMKDWMDHVLNSYIPQKTSESSTNNSIIDWNVFDSTKQVDIVSDIILGVVPEPKLGQLLLHLPDDNIKCFVLDALMNQAQLDSDTITLLFDMIFDSKYSSKFYLVDSVVRVLRSQEALDVEFIHRLINYFTRCITKIKLFSRSLIIASFASSILSCSIIDDLNSNLVDKFIKLLEYDDRLEDPCNKMNIFSRLCILRALSRVEDSESKVETILLNELFNPFHHDKSLSFAAAAFTKRHALSSNGADVLRECSYGSYYNVLYAFVLACTGETPYKSYCNNEPVLSYYNTNEKPFEASRIYKTCLGTPAQDILTIILKTIGNTFDSLNFTCSDEVEVGIISSPPPPPSVVENKVPVHIMVETLSKEDVDLKLRIDTATELATKLGPVDAYKYLDELKDILDLKIRNEPNQTIEPSQKPNDDDNNKDVVELSPENQTFLFNLIKKQIEEGKELKPEEINVKYAADILQYQIECKDDEFINMLIESTDNCSDLFIKEEVLHALTNCTHVEQLHLFKIKLLFDFTIDERLRYCIIEDLDQLDLSETSQNELETQLLSNDNVILLRNILSACVEVFNVQNGLTYNGLDKDPIIYLTKSQGKVTKTILSHILNHERKEDILNGHALIEKEQNLGVQLERKDKEDKLLNEKKDFVGSNLLQVPRTCWSESELGSLIKGLCDIDLDKRQRKLNANLLGSVCCGLGKDIIDQIISCCCGSIEGVELLLIILDGSNNLTHVTVNELIHILSLSTYECIKDETGLSLLHEKLKQICNSDSYDIREIGGRLALGNMNYTSDDLLNFILLLDFQWVDIAVFINVISILKYQNLNQMIDVVKTKDPRITPKNIEILYKLVLAPMRYDDQKYFPPVLVENTENPIFIKAIKYTQKGLDFPSDALEDDLSRVFRCQTIDEIRHELKSNITFQPDEISFDGLGSKIIYKRSPSLQLCKIEISMKFNGDLYDLVIQGLKPNHNHDFNFVHLDLSNNSLRTKHMKQLCKVLVESPLASELKSLILSHNSFTYKDLEHLCKVLATANRPNIEFLFIDHNDIYTSKDEFAQLFHGFKVSEGHLQTQPLFHDKFVLIDISMNFFGAFVQQSFCSLPPNCLDDDATKLNIVLKYIEDSDYIVSKYEKPVKFLNGPNGDDDKDINNQVLLSGGGGILSLIVRSGPFSISGHTCLTIERLQPNFPSQRELIKADLICENGRIKIRLFNISPDELLKLRQGSWSRTAWVDNNKIQTFLNRLHDDKFIADFKTYSRLNVFNKRGLYNCYSYAVERLREVGIEIEWTYRTRPSVGCQIQ